MRFRAAQHLRRQLDIKAVRERGRRVDCQTFTIWWKQREHPTAAGGSTVQLPRVCVIASTKAVGNAVQRNRARRRLREVFRLHQHHVAPDCDVLLIARAAATACPMGELEKKFLAGCSRITSISPLGNK